MFDIILGTFDQYDWVIISIGSAGNDIQQQCPNFARQLALENRVVVYNFDPAFSESLFSEESGVSVFRIKNGFPFHRDNEVCRALSDDFCTLVKGLLLHRRKIILLSCAIPVPPDAFLMAADQNNMAMESRDLFLIGSYCKDFLTVIYHPSFLQQWFSNHIHGEKPLLWSMPQQHNEFWSSMKNPSDTYYSLGENELERHQAFQEIQARFSSMGHVEKRLEAIDGAQFSPRTSLAVVTANSLMETPSVVRRETDQPPISASFLLRVLTHPATKVAAGLFIFIGVIGLVFGGIGLTGIGIGLGLLGSAALAGASSGVMITGAGLGVASFFSSSKLKAEHLTQNFNLMPEALAVSF